MPPEADPSDADRETPSAVDPPPRSAARNRGFAGRLAAEFVVIVAGVLVALAADAAWDVRGEREQEERYYESLLADLRADTTEYGVAIRMTRRSLETAGAVRAVILGDPPPPDRPLSQALHYASWVNYPDWSSGTIEELYGAGTIRLIRDAGIKDALHAYRALVAEWRPRMQGSEYSAFQDYRRATVGLIPLEAGMAYERTSLVDETPEAFGVPVDEDALVRRIQGDTTLLKVTELMMLEWNSLLVFYDEQLGEAVELLELLEARVTRR